VVLGLLISVPVVMWGSTLVLRLVERYPGIVYLGAAVLCFTAAKMIASEPLFRATISAHPTLGWLPYASIPLVLWAGFVKNHHQLESRIHARLSAFAQQRPVGASTADSSAALESPAPAGDLAMLKVLVPVDGTGNSLTAVRHVITQYQRHHELELHLLNVQPRLSAHVSRWISRRNREDFYAEQAGSALKQAHELLDAAGVPHQTHWRVGQRAAEICRSAGELGADHIVMGTARKNSLTRMLEDSVTSAVLEKTPVPVEVIAGAQVSWLERWLLPMGVGGLGLGGLVWLAID
jgi:nucleotide-binding universal stress UspA family protein